MSPEARDSFDAAVVGAGTAGSTLAYYLGRSGLSVALIDQKAKDEIGDKVCGDATSDRHFQATGLPRPSGPSRVNVIDGLKIFSPDKTAMYTITAVYKGYMVDRHAWGQNLLTMALDNGAKLFDNCIAQDLILEENCAKGVKLVNKADKRIVQVRAKVVVDASGYPAALRHKVPASWGIDHDIPRRDVIDSYREIVKLQRPFEDTSYCHIYFNSRFAPGGYVWVFPASEDGYLVNVGNGVQLERWDYRKAKDLLMDYYAASPLFHDAKAVKRGTWPIPNRRPISKPVSNGFMIVGDAAVQIDPATAEGIGYGLYGAYAAAKTIREAVEAGDVSEGRLWGYAHDYMTNHDYGVRQANFEVFRYLLQSSTDEEFNFAMGSGLITEDEVSKAGREDVSLTFSEKVRRFAKGALALKIGLLRRLDYTLSKMREVKALYKNYPDNPGAYYKWRTFEERFFRELERRLRPRVS